MPPNSTTEANKVSVASPPHVPSIRLNEDEALDCNTSRHVQNTGDERLRGKDAAKQRQSLDDHEVHHHHHHHHDYNYKFSLKQMYYDFVHLDFSKVLWEMVACMVVFHVASFYAIYLLVTLQVFLYTFLYMALLAYSGGLGVTMGVHRHWAHKAFNAHWSVRLILMLLNSLAFQESIFLWAQNHRVHHKWSDTDKDFTNSRRGFFFAHMGWKMYQTHPDVIKARKMIDCSDLLADPFVKFQHDYYYYVSLPVCFVFPPLIPYFCWGEDLLFAFLVCSVLRLCITFHVTWCINSIAHLYGNKPYDKRLHAYEHKFLGGFALGEGWHNYHHTFPEDYRASEIKGWGDNLTTEIIEVLNKVGLTYDLKTPPPDRVEKRITRTGDHALREKLLLEKNIVIDERGARCKRT